MNSAEAKLWAIGIVLLLIVAPFIFWLGVYLATRQSSIALRPMLPWIRALRWIVWTCGLAILVYSLMVEKALHDVGYGIAATTFSTGMGFPEKWIKRKLLEGQPHKERPLISYPVVGRFSDDT